MKNGHAKLAPSFSSTWTECTAAPDFIQENQDRIPREDSTEFSREGTEAHGYAAGLLEGNLIDMPEEFREPIGAYVEFANRIRKEEDTVFIEKKVPLFYSPSDYGTVDYMLISDERAYVLDLKYGKGIIVEAKDNKQLAIYALSALEHLQGSGLYDFSDDFLIIMAIYQPRTYEDNPLKLWVITLEELRLFGEGISTAAIEIEMGDTKFSPSESNCRFCKAKHICKERADFYSKPVEGVFFEDISDGVKTDTLTDDQIVWLIDNKKGVEKFLADVWSGALALAEQGNPVKGTKLVMGRPGNRAWTDEEAAGKLLAKHISAGDRFVRKLISVAVAEKLLKPRSTELTTRFQNRFLELVTQPPGKPILTLESDKRDSIEVPNISETFDPLA